MQLNMCPCGSCKQTSELKLKFVAHVGEVATQTIKHRKKLVGLDVIYIHRMLKNPVDVPEYLLVTDELLRHGGSASSQSGMRDVDLDLEGIGQVRTHFLTSVTWPCRAPQPSWPQRLGGTLAMVGRGIPYALGRRRPPALTSAG